MLVTSAMVAEVDMYLYVSEGKSIDVAATVVRAGWVAVPRASP